MESRSVFVSFLIFLLVSAETRALGESKEEPNRFLFVSHLLFFDLCLSP